MRYVLSIDWLAIFCRYSQPDAWVGVTGSSDSIGAAYPWRYHREDFGTRQFKHLTRVSMPNEQCGYDEFAEVQSDPCSDILARGSMIVRFVNRVLYRQDFWDLADKFLADNCIEYRSISRVDICADFNDFATISPMELIREFANKRLRHIGRGVGALYFNHGVTRGEYGVNYTGLSFGTHSSDARVYLYNKSFELLTQGDKPWIRDRWNAVGLDARTVWRLEVSLKSKACKFKDKRTGREIIVNDYRVRSTDKGLPKIFHTFERKLFSFIKNRPGITNVTREPRLQLFVGVPAFERGVLRNVTGSNRLDRMVIKSLYLMGGTYRGQEVRDVSGYAQTLACVLAESTDLVDWLQDKSTQWEQKTHR